MSAAAAAVGGWAIAAGLRARQRRRDELMARACHELAGPLQAADLALHQARREASAARVRATGGPGGASGPRLAAIDLELRRAARALEDLDAARAGRRARDHAGVVDVGCLLAQQALTWQSAARSRGRSVRVCAGSGLLVRGDLVRLAQAVGNLLANALEHGSGAIELRAERRDRAVRIEVADHGTGLPKPLPELRRHARAGRGHRGRGLAITADIAARHGGRLLSAPTTAGARLAIELPALRRAA